MIYKKIKFNQQGMTLMELVLYLAIVAILFTALINFHLTLSSTANKVASNADASRNRRTALNSIDYLIKNADGLLKDVNGECSDFTTTPQTLALYFENDTYLPGTCVEGGGGVRISVGNRQVKVTCYPNIPYNGWHQACDTSVFTAGNVYYLTGPDVVVYSENLSFSTSTATSTANSFSNVTTNIVVNALSGGQLGLAATSTATSTVTLRNEQFSGLVSWWKFDQSSFATIIDQMGKNTLPCPVGPTATSTVVDGGGSAAYFNYGANNYCISATGGLGMDGSFTIATWLKYYTSAAAQGFIIFNSDFTNYGYSFYVEPDGGLFLRLCDTTNSCAVVLSEDAILEPAETYHVSVVYDLEGDSATMYLYQKGVGQISTTTVSSVPTLVNGLPGSNAEIFGFGLTGNLDELRLYNRALSTEEVWTLQSQGL